MLDFVAIEWMSDDLLAKIEKDPVLSEAFQDPVLSQALLHFQTNPQQALAAVKDDPRVSSLQIELLRVIEEIEWW